MSSHDISESIRQFIFECIHSVEQLEIILALRSAPERWWTVEDLSRDLRSSAGSIETRLSDIADIHLLEYSPTDPKHFRYLNGNDKDQQIGELADLYRVRRQAILELIFSPLKKARNFANAFVIPNRSKKNEGNNG